MTPEKIKVWITKYALTKGIIEAEALDCGGSMIAVRTSTPWLNSYHRNDWHKSEQSAKRWACVMRDKRIASLKNQIAKLEAMTFEENQK